MPLIDVMFVTGWKKIRGFSLAVVAGTVLCAQPQERPLAPIDLPKIEVTAPAIPEKRDAWRYARVARFEVLSKVSDSSGRRLLSSLQKFDHALRVVYPAATEGQAQPMAILLTRDSQFREIAPFGYQFGTQEFSLFLPGSERSVIVVNMDGDAGLSTPAGYHPSEATVDPYRQLHRQYLRALFAGRNTKLPSWLEEGLAQALADIEMRGKWLTYGKIETEQNMPVGEQPYPMPIADYAAANPMLSGLSFNQVFARRSLLPMAEFFAAQRADGSTPSSDSAWAKQAYAFVHFCLFGNQLRYREPLITLAQRLHTEALSEELFHECFGVNYAGMQDKLRGYILLPRHRYQRYSLKPAQQAKPETAEFREASAAEIGLLKGETFILSDRPGAARESYERAYRHGANTPEFFAAWAASCALVGQTARAHRLIDAAVQSGVSQPSAHVLQARLRLENFTGTPATLSNGQMAAVLSPLFAARKLGPALPETYELIAEAWSRSGTQPKPAHLAVLDEGIRRFPRDMDLLTRSHELYRRIGDSEKAASIARLGVRFAPDATARAHFEKLVPATAAGP